MRSPPLNHIRNGIKDHVSCKWIKGKALEKASILYSVEFLHGRLHRLKALSTKIEPDRKVTYRFLFPIVLLCPKGSYVIEPKEKKSNFTPTLSFNFSRLLSEIVPNSFEAVKHHLKEEGENLKTLLENE